MSSGIKLAIVCTHPVQYYAPVFKYLADNVDLQVFYTAGKNFKYDRGFGLDIEWDLPLLEGYRFQFLKNNARKPGTYHFMGTINPDAIKQIDQYAPSHILVFGWAHYSHFKILHHYRKRCKILFRGDSNCLHKDNFLRSTVKALVLKYIYRCVNHAFYTGTSNLQYFRKYGLKNNQLTFAPHVVDNVRFARFDYEYQVREKIRIKRTDTLILFAGKFSPVKNPELLLGAFLQLRLKDTHLLMVGDGPLAKHLRTKYKHEKIHFLPFQNQSKMPAIYQSCDLFCMPSRSESWGLAVNEAMAAGKAILVSDMVGSGADLVSPENGMIFQSNNIEDLKQKLRLLTDKRHDLITKGHTSREIIQNWTFDVQVKNILNALSA